MKVYLDDVRDPPEGWTAARTLHEAITLLRDNYVTHISLDHDLGTSETGYDLIHLMKQFKVFPPEITIHSWNPVGVLRMKTLLEDLGHHPQISRDPNPPRSPHGSA